MVIESDSPLEIGSFVTIAETECEPDDGNFARGVVLRQITEAEYVEFNKLEDPDFEANRPAYIESRPELFHYEVRVD